MMKTKLMTKVIDLYSQRQALNYHQEERSAKITDSNNSRPEKSSAENTDSSNPSQEKLSSDKTDSSKSNKAVKQQKFPIGIRVKRKILGQFHIGKAVSYDAHR